MGQEVTELRSGPSEGSGFTCPDCGGHSFSTVMHSDEFEYGSGDSPVTLHARVPVHCCGSCDFEFLGREGRLIKHEAVCRHLDLLTPTEIRSIRERHGMSRTVFAEVTGFGEATLNRWERGAVIQNRANDRYLRVVDSPEVLDRLKRIHHGPSNAETRETVAAQRPRPDGTLKFPRLRDSPGIRQDQSAFRLVRSAA